MKTYKVWAHVEEVDEAADTYEDVTIPESLGEYTSLEAAIAAVAAAEMLLNIEPVDEGDPIVPVELIPDENEHIDPSSPKTGPEDAPGEANA